MKSVCAYTIIWTCIYIYARVCVCKDPQELVDPSSENRCPSATYSSLWVTSMRAGRLALVPALAHGEAVREVVLIGVILTAQRFVRPLTRSYIKCVRKNVWMLWKSFEELNWDMGMCLFNCKKLIGLCCFFRRYPALRRVPWGPLLSALFPQLWVSFREMHCALKG